MITNIVGVPIT